MQLGLWLILQLGCITESATADPPSVPGPQVILLQPDAGGCAWQIVDLAGTATPLGRSPTCPVELLWNPNGREILGVFEDRVVRVGRGGHVLVAEEFTGARPQVYATGATDPVLTASDALGGVWVPQHGP